MKLRIVEDTLGFYSSGKGLSRWYRLEKENSSTISGGTYWSLITSGSNYEILEEQARRLISVGEHFVVRATFETTSSVTDENERYAV